MIDQKIINKGVSKLGLGSGFLWLISHKRYFYFLLSLIFVLFLLSLIILFQMTEEEIFFCGDGTFNNTCSFTKPYYCVDGALIEKASVCGCPEGFIEDGGVCLSKYQTNPKNITLKYILDGKENNINFTVYEGLTEYLSKISRSIEYADGEVPSRADFKFLKINEEIQRPFLLPLVIEIKNLAKEKEEQMRIAVSIVQNIEWGYSNKTVGFSKKGLTYSRYPYEILYDSMGICGEKSELLTFLLKELEYDVVIFYNKKENHESVGIKCPLESSWNNSGYCFIETSGPSIISDTSINYVGGVRITSDPQIINISKGEPLGEGLQEFKDAKILMKIRKKITEKGRINFFDKWKLSELSEKYGLVGEYNLA